MVDLNRSEWTLRLGDHDKDVTQISFRRGPTNAAGLVADTAKAAALRDAIKAITRGTTLLDSYGNITYPDVTTYPAAAGAQKQIQWVMEGQDTVTNRTYIFPIGTALLDDVTTKVVGDKTELDMTGDEGAALETAWDAFAPQSPEGNVMSLNRVYFRGIRGG